MNAVGTGTASMVINQITVAFLFKDGNYGDVVSEVGRIQYSDSPWAAGDLSVIDATAATWSGPGSVTNVSQGLQCCAGMWQIDNPFGATPVKFLEFTALHVGGAQAPYTSANSDYSFVSLNATATPEPSTWGMLGLGLCAITPRAASSGTASDPTYAPERGPTPPHSPLRTLPRRTRRNPLIHSWQCK